jgi:Family of unknown function (DUF6516)
VRNAARLLRGVDDTTDVSCVVGRGVIREEVWQDSRGRVAKYNLAFINHFMCSVDHGRVLGYDNRHGNHHIHFMGEETDFSFESYEKLLRRFLAEVKKLRKGTHV